MFSRIQISFVPPIAKRIVPLILNNLVHRAKIVYSGFGPSSDACKEAQHLSKPADPQLLVTVLQDLILGRSVPHRESKPTPRLPKRTPISRPRSYPWGL